MMPWGGRGVGEDGNVRNGYDTSNENSYTPSRPSHGASRSTGREMPNKHTNEIEKRRPGLPPVVNSHPTHQSSDDVPLLSAEKEGRTR
jgi:hypothetical protein